MVLPQTQKQKRQSKPNAGNNILLLSHALAFVAGLIIHGLINREDCGDVILKEISKIGSKLSFLDLGLKTGTDKVQGQKNFPLCLKDGKMCNQAKHVREECQPFGHFYHTLYQQKLGSYYSSKDAEPFQFLEVGFFKGHGYDTYREFLPRGECHSIEISCLPHGDRKDGKWVSAG